jgi:hypothetical protein
VYEVQSEGNVVYGDVCELKDERIFYGDVVCEVQDEANVVYSEVCVKYGRRKCL